jgi:class 3 adenylate cyclase
VGINTGQVLVGGGMEAENNAMGMAVNLGARLESLASPGSVLISHDTYRHVRGLFDVEEQPLARVKGSDKPVRTYVVLQARERSFRNTLAALDLETPMVGRVGS